MNVVVLGSGPLALQLIERLGRVGHGLLDEYQAAQAGEAVLILAAADGIDRLPAADALAGRVLIDLVGAAQALGSLPVRVFGAGIDELPDDAELTLAGGDERARQSARSLFESIGIEVSLRHDTLPPVSPSAEAPIAFVGSEEQHMNTTLPALFVSHGAPTFAIDPGVAGPKLAALGRGLPRPRAVLMISPHWMTRGGVAVTASARPETLHDFGGFAQALYELQYPAPGAPELAAQVVERLGRAGIVAALDAQRGLDHGAWVPLMHLLPEATVPVIQVSLPYPCDAAAALRLGQALAPLREEGVLIVGSGSLTHNLYEFRRHHGGDEAYVRAFANWVREALRQGDPQALLDYRRLAPDAERAHPTEEHFLPLLVALGARLDGDALTVIDGGIAHGVLSMDAYLFGEAA